MIHKSRTLLHGICYFVPLLTKVTIVETSTVNGTEPSFDKYSLLERQCSAHEHQLSFYCIYLNIHLKEEGVLKLTLGESVASTDVFCFPDL